MIQASTKDAYWLLHQGSLTMAEMERNGLCIDLNRVRESRDQINAKVDNLRQRLFESEVYLKWRKVYGPGLKLNSREQLGSVLFDFCGVPYPGKDRTKTGRYRMDRAILEAVNVGFTRDYLRIRQLLQARNTYLNNIYQETINGFIHPIFNLHLVRTFRSSCDHPNFQNIPKHDPEIMQLIRRCFVARPGCYMVDLDFKGSEVNAASWYHKDPRMLQYIKTDPGRMHTEAAIRCFKVPASEMTPTIRYAAKNNFVFPQFYGDWYISCARNLWNAIDKLKLTTKSGIPLKKWLYRKGITELGSCDPEAETVPGTFVYHIQQVEREFWSKLFPVYQQWKRDWWETYQRSGFLQMLSGFVIHGPLSRKESINYPIQGTAFHCLLWCCIRLSQLLRKYKMKTLLTGQIHDDVISDTPENELKDYIDLAITVITKELKEHWPWIITPMRVEVQVTPLNGSWSESKEYKL